MERAAHDGFIKVNITVPDLKVKATIRISANPGFVVNSRPLAAEIRQGHQGTGVTLLTFGKT